MFRDKEYVYEVWRARSFSKAASRMYISQPSLSAKIKRIEENLGAQIFDRTSSPLRLTEFGQHYIDAIGEVHQIEKKIASRIKEGASFLGKVSVGASDTVADCVLPQILVALQEKIPNTKVKIVEGESAALEELLTHGEIDLLLGENRILGKPFESRECLREELFLALPKDFPEGKAIEKYALDEACAQSANAPFLPLSLVRGVPFVLPPNESSHRTQLEKLCREAGFRPRVAAEAERATTAYALAAAGVGALFVSDTLMRATPHFDRLYYFKLESEFSHRSIYLTHKKNKTKTAAAKELIRLIFSK